MKNEIKTINRRGFLEHSAKITVAGFLMSRLPAGSKKLISFEGEIKVALVGCGGRGTGAISQALEADPDVRLVAMADAFGDRAEECVKTLIEKFADSDRINVNRETIFTGFDAYKQAIGMADVVILTTPPAFAHFILNMPSVKVNTYLWKNRWRQMWLEFERFWLQGKKPAAKN